MQPPGPPRPFRGAQYDKDMFTFLPAHSTNRDILAESSRKRKATPDRQITISAPNVRHGVSAISDSKLNAGNLQVKEIQGSLPALQPRELSVKGYCDQSQYWDQNDYGAKRYRNEMGSYESRSEYAGYTSFSGQLQSPNHTHRGSNFLPSATEGLNQHDNREPNSHVHVATHETSNGPPPMTQDLNHPKHQELDGHVASVENVSRSQEISSYSHQNPVQIMTSDFYDQASNSLGESQRFLQNVLLPGPVMESLAEKGRHEEKAHNGGSSSNVKQNNTDNVADLDSNNSSGNNVSSSLYSLQSETNNLIKVLRLLSAASGIVLADNNDNNIQVCGHDVSMLKSPPGSIIQNVNQSSAGSNLSMNPEKSSNLKKSAAVVEKGSVKLDEECKSEDGPTSSAEKLWDGTLQLSTSVSASVIAFFKSGDKMQDLNWSESVEVKGKVRLEAFEKYVQDLPRSRSRGLMVMSFCWKEGSSIAGRKGMKEVAKKYKDGKRVGFAKLSSDVDLYICPHSDAIITILAKHGFFHGMTAIKDISVPLIGCAVWKKNSSSAPATKTAKAPKVAVENSKRDKSPEFSISPQASQAKQSMLSPKSSTSISDTSSQPSMPVLPAPPVASKQPADFSDNDDDLPEYDFTATVSQACVSKTSAEMKSESSTATVSFPVPDTHFLGKDAENNLRQYPAATEASVPTQEQKQIEHLQETDQQNLSQQAEVKIPSLLIQEQKPTEKPRNIFDDDDMPEWCPPDFMKKKESRTEVSFPLSNSMVPGPGFADLGSGHMPLPMPPPPPPLPPPPLRLPPPPPRPPPPPPPQMSEMTQMHIKERDYSSAPRIPPPPITSNPVHNKFMHHSPATPSTQMQFRDKNSAAPSSQTQFKERDYSSAPLAPPPPVGNPAANNFMHYGPPAMSSQFQFNERDHSSAPRVPAPPTGNPAAANNFMRQSPPAQLSQTQFGDKSYFPAPHPSTPFADKSVSGGLIRQNPAFHPGFAPSSAFRPSFDQPDVENPRRPWSTRL